MRVIKRRKSSSKRRQVKAGVCSQCLKNGGRRGCVNGQKVPATPCGVCVRKMVYKMPACHAVVQTEARTVTCVVVVGIVELQKGMA